MRIFLLLFSFMATINAFAQVQRVCHAHDHYTEMMTADPDYARRSQEIELYTQQYLRSLTPDQMKTGEVIIPVVFHIVYNTAAQNISDQRILEQLETLNLDYTARNADTSTIPDPFKPLKGAFNVKFVIANRDPQGNPAVGIVRRQTTRTSFGSSSTPSPTAQPVKFTNQGGSDAWDTRYYLNIWVCNLSGGVLGYATFPASAGTPYDGIVLASRYTGTTGAGAPFNLGRTGTHEVGHYFNLRHIWGDDFNCSGSDQVADTPNQRVSTSGCPSYPLTDNCSNATPGIMFMNYMDYTNDACMYMFTQGQVNRMQAALDGPRATLLNSPGYVEPSINNNDIAITGISAPTGTSCSNTVTPVAGFTNKGDNVITSFKANYQVNGGSVVSQLWSGSLAPDSTITITFDEAISLANGAYTALFFSSDPNDTVDNNLSDDTLSVAFSFASLSSPDITGNFQICAGDSTTLTASAGSFSYAWSTGESTQSIVVKPSGTSEYSLIITDGNGCTAEALATVSVVPIPAAPEASSNSPIFAGDTLFLTANTVPGASYSWTGPEGFTSTEQNPFISNTNPLLSGEYTVSITVNGCTSESTTITVLVNNTTSVQLNELAGLTVAPNPFRAYTSVSFELSAPRTCVLSISDISGREVEKQVFQAGAGRHVLETGRNLSNGTYLLSIDTGKEQHTLKLVVIQ